jgi:hypothetical protein
MLTVKKRRAEGGIGGGVSRIFQEFQEETNGAVWSKQNQSTHQQPKTAD